jgi:hypothetical protein
MARKRGAWLTRIAALSCSSSSDLVVPGLAGRQIAERIRPLRPTPSVLHMSGYTGGRVVRCGVAGRGAALM